MLAAEGVPDNLRIHDLRHTCASLLIAQGANIKAVQERLGHKTAAMTLDRYGHLYPDEQDRLAGALNAAREDALCDGARTNRGPEGGTPRGHERISAGQEWARQDSNLGPTDYESAALTA